MKRLATTSSRGLAAAAPRPAVKPASRTSLAISMVTSMCSSSSIMLMGSMPGALFQERWRCASIMPGISVAPMPSITVAPEPVGREARAAAGDLLDAVALDEHLAGDRDTRPVPSRTRTLVNRTESDSLPLPLPRALYPFSAIRSSLSTSRDLRSDTGAASRSRLMFDLFQEFGNAPVGFRPASRSSASGRHGRW